MPTSDFYSDTDPKVLEIWIDGFRKMAPEQRVKMAMDQSRFAFGMAEANVRQQYPEADDREVKLRVASRYLDADLMIRAFAWNPKLHH